jgi:hypothetical protein
MDDVERPRDARNSAFPLFRFHPGLKPGRVIPQVLVIDKVE